MGETHEMNEALRRKYEGFLEHLRGYGRLAVAYSGGIDSTLLLHAAGQALGAENALGLIASSETLTDEEFQAALAIARDFGFRLEKIAYSELEIENYAENPLNRCYFCKNELFGRLGEAAEALGFERLADGSTFDDLTGDYRPGMQAARERGVVSPFIECKLRKPDIRAMARALGLPNWDKPSGACLSSRFPYGTRITQERLDQVAEAEHALRALGFAQVRVRWHDSVARIEVDPEAITRLAEPELRQKAARAVREAGFRYAALDLLGYRTGSLNEGLDLPKNAG